jgi:cell division protein FtsQ
MSTQRVAGRPRPRSDSAADRFARRQRVGRRVLLRRVVVLLVIAAVVGGSAWLVGWSPVLAVRSVRVEGLTGADAQAAQALAARLEGTPLIRVDTESLAREIESRKAVAQARVDRSWPATLVVVGVPRTAAIVLKNPQGQLEVVDAGGVRFGIVGSRPDGVPLVTATGSDATSEDALSSASLITFTTGRTTLVWGGAGDEARKVALVKALLPRRPSVIDVSAPDTPVTR